MDDAAPCDDRRWALATRAARPRLQGRPAERIKALAEAALFGDASPLRIGPYEVIRGLAHGGAGIVYLARDVELDRLIALKLVRHEDGDGAFRDQLVREAKTLARLSHPAIVSAHAAVTHGDDVYLAMEHVEGLTLTGWLARERRSWPAIVEVFVQAARGLEAAHRAGVIHRDFKPDNVLVGADGRVRVVDFGLARPCAAPSVDLDNEATIPEGFIASTTPAGTPLYMAPELFAGEPASVASDQYSFCFALYLALAGRYPFDGDVGTSLLEHKRSTVPRRLRGVPRRLARAVLRGLAPTPASRHRDMTALVRVLTRTLPDRRRRVMWMMAGAAVSAAWLFAAAPSEVERCREQSAARAATLYDDAARAGLRDAFVATGVPFAERSFEGLDARLRQHRDTWASTYALACATPVEDRSRREACLEVAAGEIEALLSVGASPTASQVATALELPDLLSDPSSCLRDDGDPMPFEERRALTERRIEIDLLVRRDRTGAQEALEVIAADLDQPELRPEARATLELARGEILEQVGGLEAAVEAFDRAWIEAERAKLTPLAIEAMFAKAAALGALGRADASSRLLDVIAARGVSDALAPRLDYERALAAYRRGELESVIELAEASLAGFRARNLVPDRRRGRAVRLLAMVMADAGQFEKAHASLDEHARDVPRLYGPDHPELASVDLARAEVLRIETRNAEALALATTALARLLDDPASPPAARVEALLLVGGLELTLGRPAHALDTSTQHVALLEAWVGDAHPAIVDPWLVQAMASMDCGRPRDAARIIERALELVRSESGPSRSLQLAVLDVLAADALASAGDHDVAHDRARAAYDTFMRAAPEAPVAHLARLALARIEILRGKVDRALALVETAPEGAGPLQLQLEAARASVLRDAGRPEAALASLSNLHGALLERGRDVPRELFAAELELAELFVERGDRLAAVNMALAATTTARAHDLQLADVARAHALLAELGGPPDRDSDRILQGCRDAGRNEEHVDE